MYDYKAEKSNKNLPQQCKQDIHPQQTRHEFGSIIFDSKFDSGNLEKVERNASLKNNHFNLWVCNDCKGTQKATNYRTWFYFSVQGVQPETTLTFTIMNLNFQNKMFREGMTPTYKSSASNSWQRVKSNIAATMENNDNGLEITWTHKFDSQDEKVWFSFTYPFSYEDNDKMWNEYEEILKNDENIYLHRCTLIKSKEDRKVELITISSQSNKLTTYEKSIPNLFTDTDQSLSRPALFKNKKYVFFSARVHPGETPGSHVFNGIIKLLLDRDDPRAKILRDNFVFYCIPMINPDGVYRGHYRTDTSGLNLNRFYINPSLQEQPSVYAIKELILHLNETKRLHCYIDLHAHATKKGVFIYGNCLDLKDQLDTCVFPRLLSLNSPYFEYDSCNFTEKNMYCKDKGDGLSKEGAGRVALYKATKLNLCYTLECNYNTGTYTNKMFDYNYDNEKKENEGYEQDVIVNGIDFQNLKTTTFYNIEMFQQVGEGICDALLDYSSIHPHSRISNTPYKTLANMKMRMAYNLLKITPFRFCQYLRKVFRFISINENIERVLKCLWIYLNTGIKNELQDNTKPLITKVNGQNDTNKQNNNNGIPLKRQATLLQKKSSDKSNVNTPAVNQQQFKKNNNNVNPSQERKNIFIQQNQQIKTVSQLLAHSNTTSQNENNNNNNIIDNLLQSQLLKRPISQKQDRQYIQDYQFDDKQIRQAIDLDITNIVIINTNNKDNNNNINGSRMNKNSSNNINNNNNNFDDIENNESESCEDNNINTQDIETKNNNIKEYRRQVKRSSQKSISKQQQQQQNLQQNQQQLLQSQMYYSSETNIPQNNNNNNNNDYIPSSIKSHKHPFNRYNNNNNTNNNNMNNTSRLEDSFSYELNNNNKDQEDQQKQQLQQQQQSEQIQKKQQIEQQNIIEQYMISSALPKRPTSKKLNHSYIRKNTNQQLQPLSQKFINDITNNNNNNVQNYTLNNQSNQADCSINLNQNNNNGFQINSHNQENKEPFNKQFNVVKINDSKPYIAEFDDRFTKVRDIQMNQLLAQNLKSEELMIRPKKMSTQQQQQQQQQMQQYAQNAQLAQQQQQSQQLVKQTRIIIDTQSKNKQRSESQKTDNIKHMNTHHRSKSRNTTRILPKKKVN